MMSVRDGYRYARHRAARTQTFGIEFWLTALLLGSVGAITWAIRGTGGWDGIDGTIVPGMAWGLLWYYICRRKGIDAGVVPLWLGLGIALGGELGYGQYVSWIRGEFYVAEDTLPLAPWIGYAWFAIIGVAKASAGAAALGWALSEKATLHRWLERLVMPLGVALLARITIQLQPQWFFPHYTPQLYGSIGPVSPGWVLSSQWGFIVAWCAGAALIGLVRSRTPRALFKPVASFALLYCAALFLTMGWWLFMPDDNLGMFHGELDKHLGRTVYTNSQNFIIAAWLIGILITAALQRDRTTLVIGSLIGLGYGPGFMASALWCIGYIHAPDYIDWWKLWELNAGFNLGLLYAIALYWAIRRTHKGHDAQAEPISALPESGRAETSFRVFAGTVGVFLILAASLYEFDKWTGISLAVFYVLALAVLLARLDPAVALSRAAAVFTGFILLFFLLHGVTYTLGVMLELYEVKAVDQYAWPAPRIALFIPPAAILVVLTLLKLSRAARAPEPESDPRTTIDRLADRITDLIAFIGLIGAISIWPAEIAVLYAAFLCLAIFAHNRLNRRLDQANEIAAPDDGL